MKINYRSKGILTATLALLVAAMVGIKVSAQLPPPPPGEGHVAIALGPGGMDMEFFAKTVTGAPFSAQVATEENQTLSDGNQIHRTSTAALYRDSQGRTRREGSMGLFGPWFGPAGSTPSFVMIHDPVAGVNYILNPDKKVAHKMPPPMRVKAQSATAGATTATSEDAPQLARGAVGFAVADKGGMMMEERIEEEGGTVNKESLGTQVIEGVQAEGTRRTVTLPAGSVGNVKPIQIVTERWYSPALQLVVMSKRSDPRIGETTYRLTNINQAEPAPDLFQVPADYTIKEGPGQIRLRAHRPID